MEYIDDNELMELNGGGVLMDTYKDVRDFVNDHLGDLVRGIKDGWNSK